MKMVKQFPIFKHLDEVRLRVMQFSSVVRLALESQRILVIVAIAYMFYNG